MVALLSMLMGCSFYSKSEQPIIVLISIDTLRADHLSSYGYERETSPFIDSLAKDGVRLEWARSPSPWTLPSHTTMLTGLLPSTHHIVDDSVSLTDSVDFLPELLQQKGWQTGGVVSTMYVSSLFGFDRGFDYFEDFSLHTEKKNLAGEVNAVDVIDKAIDWFDQQSAEKPIFLFLHFYDVHYSYNAPLPYNLWFDRASDKSDPKYRNYFFFKKQKNRLTEKQFEHQRAQYDEEIHYVDDQLERLASRLNRSRSTVLWTITSDHGEEFGERDSWGHAHTLYAEQLRVPLIFSGGDIGAGVIEEGWAGTQDIAPTLLSLAGLEDSLASDGIDLTSYFPEGALPERPMLAETTRFKTNRLSLLEQDFRLEWDLKTDRAELFQTKNDPQEKENIAKQNPQKVLDMKIRMEELLGSPWVAKEEGMVMFPKGVSLAEGRYSNQVKVTAGSSFLVLPYDLEVFFKGTDDEEKKGPWKNIGGELPTTSDPLLFQGTQGADTVQKDEKTKQLLESLGYIQE